jgi:hypothetical protein
VHKRVAVLSLMAAFAAGAGTAPGDWTGHFAPCDGHAELLKSGPMNIGVRFSTSNRALAGEFARAMSFWATVLDMTWREENSRQCAIQIVDGSRGLFKPGEAARAQFPCALSFQGWIAFNPRIPLAGNDLFSVAVHELGHLLGLMHNANPASVMYFLRVDGPPLLDDADLAALAVRHRLRLTVASRFRVSTRLESSYWSDDSLRLR